MLGSLQHLSAAFVCLSMDLSHDVRVLRKQAKGLVYSALGEISGQLGGNGDPKVMEDRLLVLRVLKPAILFSMGMDACISDVRSGLLEYVAWSDWRCSPAVDAARAAFKPVSWESERRRLGFS